MFYTQSTSTVISRRVCLYFFCPKINSYRKTCPFALVKVGFSFVGWLNFVASLERTKLPPKPFIFQHCINPFAGNSSCCTCSSHCVQYLCESRQGYIFYGCHCVGYLACVQMLVHAVALRGCKNAVKRVYAESTLRASLSGPFLQTLPDFVTPLKGHSLSPRSCPPTRSTPSESFRY